MSTKTADDNVLHGYFRLEHLRAWRYCAQLGIIALANHVGCSSRTIILTERGDRMATGSTVQRIAAALGIPTEILLTCAPSDEDAREYLTELTYRVGLARAESMARHPGGGRYLSRMPSANAPRAEASHT